MPGRRYFFWLVGLAGTLVASPPGRAQEVFRDCAECPQVVVIPAGAFEMGSLDTEPGRGDHEGPRHRVAFARPFALGVHEVTFAEWDACVAAGGCTRQAEDVGWGRERRPVVTVSWLDTQEYITWLSAITGHAYRLPSEAEWEYAARAGTETAYYWGDVSGKGNANCDGCGGRWDGDQTAPVGSFPANPFGLYDMAGNVWEWTEDCWHYGYDGAPADGSAWTGDGDCSLRVMRGGSWLGEPRLARVALRGSRWPDARDIDFGFRVARALGD